MKLIKRLGEGDQSEHCLQWGQMTVPDYFSDIDVFQTRASAMFASKYIGKHLPERAAQ